MRVLLILLAGQAMAVMDGSILTVAAPTLRADLGASDAQLQLVIAMYTIAFGALVVTGARLGDVIGPRRAFLLGLACFTLASLAGGSALDVTVLIAARAAQGAAAAVMTPQVLSIIQRQFAGEARARAMGGYSLVLAVGVAAGQVAGGLIVGADWPIASWRPALLLNAPIGLLLLVGARRGLPAPIRLEPRRLDIVGAGVLTVALLTLVVPLTLGRDAGWPTWVWPCFAVSALAVVAFVAVERRVRRRRGDPLIDLGMLRLPGIAAGVAAVMVVMGSYAGFLLSLTLYLQDELGFSPLRAGLTFAAYAAGFATASLTWTRLHGRVRAALPIVGPPLMAAGILGIGVAADGRSWPVGATTLLLAAGGIGHACAFSPLATRLTTGVRREQAADLSGLILTSSIVGNVLGVATFVGVYLDALPEGSEHALSLTGAVLAGALLVTAALAAAALAPGRRAAVATTPPAAET